MKRKALAETFGFWIGLLMGAAYISYLLLILSSCSFYPQISQMRGTFTVTTFAASDTACIKGPLTITVVAEKTYDDIDIHITSEADTVTLRAHRCDTYTYESEYEGQYYEIKFADRLERREGVIMSIADVRNFRVFGMNCFR